MPRKAATPSEPPRLESIQEAARRNSISVDTVRRRIASGELKAYRLGGRILRIDRAAVDALFRPITTTGGVRGGGDHAV
jgi:excisionase family DNA binding protein